MLHGIQGAAARVIIDTLRPRLNLPREEPLEVWGPVHASQHDAFGGLMQQSATVLLRRENGHWFFLKQVTQFQNGEQWSSPPFLHNTSEEEAQHWLAENSEENQTPADIQPASLFSGWLESLSMLLGRGAAAETRATGENGKVHSRAAVAQPVSRRLTSG